MSDVDRRRRQFVREHHPDRGGDPAEFIAGMRAFDRACDDTGPPPWTPAPRVVVVRRAKWPARLLTAAARRLGRGRKSPRVR